MDIKDRKSIGELAIDVITGIRELGRQGHTAVVLASATIIEMALQELLVVAIRPMTDKEQNHVFKRGRFRSFAIKIEVAFMFGLINEEFRGRLTELRDLRNDFAHSSAMVHLTHADVREGFEHFTRETDKKKKEAERFLEALHPIMEYLGARIEEVKKKSLFHE